MTNEQTNPEALRELRDKVMAVEASMRQIECMIKEMLQETEKVLTEIQRSLRTG